MNVINIEDLEREIRNRAARVFPPADEWLMRVVKEQMLNLNAADRAENYLVYEQPPQVERDPNLPSASEPVMKWGMVVALLQGVKIGYWDHIQECNTNLPPLPALPEWAHAAQERGEPLFLFDPVQVRRRAFWKQIDRIVNWFNSKPPPVIDWCTLSFAEAWQRADDWGQQNGLW